MRISAHDADGPVDVEIVDKQSWAVEGARGPLRITYEVYAWDLSVRTAHFDQTHAFFNNTSLCMQVEGRTDARHTLTLHLPTDPACTGWRVATTLDRLSGDEWGPGTFQAADYDELVDHPVEMGTFSVHSFEACGVPHHLVLTGRHRCDTERLTADLTAICEEHIRFFGEPAPVDRYLFLTTVVGEGYGGLEHRASTALICRRNSLPKPGEEEVSADYREFLGLCSHEYFHTWNVKRIKPAAFVPYDYQVENYTTLLWAMEGITSYYDDLGLLRCGLIDAPTYLEVLGQNFTRVLRGSGRTKQSLADSSMHAWTKFYRQDENALNSIVSYYKKGAMVALALDLRIRHITDGARSLDDVMRRMWAEYGQRGIGLEEDAVERIAAEVAGEPLGEFFDLAIRGTTDLPLPELLSPFGVSFGLRPTEGPKDKGGKPAKASNEELGKRASLGVQTRAKTGGTELSRVLDGGAAQAAGMSAGDLVVAVDGLKVGSALLDRIAEYRPGDSVQLHAFRRDELMVFEARLQAPQVDHAWLALDEDPDEAALALRHGWLGEPATENT